MASFKQTLRNWETKKEDPMPTNDNQTDQSIIIKDLKETADDKLPDSAVPSKDEYVIAVYGDSMEDTQGEVMEYLDHALKEKYPRTRFNLYNYGMGSNNASDGLARWDKPFHYMDRNYPAITEIK